jgi:hypothetical protein
MNCDDARGRALDKEGDMIGEGHKGTSGLGHDKISVKMIGPHMAFLFDPFYWPDGRVGRDAPDAVAAKLELEAAAFACGRPS